jgi:hypothetical protein
MHHLVDCDGFLEGEGLLLPVKLLDLDLHPGEKDEEVVTDYAVLIIIYEFVENIGSRCAIHAG